MAFCPNCGASLEDGATERVRVYMGTTEYLDTALFKIGV